MRALLFLLLVLPGCDTARAIEVLAFNTELFPDSSNTHDSLGEAYAKAGDRERAIESYRRALEIDPSSSSAVRALEKLQASAQ